MTKHKSEKKHETKKKISKFHSASFAIILALSISLFYFLVLVSHPRSIPFVTKKVEKALKEQFGQDSSLNKVYVSFTRYGTLKIAISDLKIFYPIKNSQEKQEFSSPTIESEFPLFRMLFGQFQPSKIKILNSVIVINKTVENLEPQKKSINSAIMPIVIEALQSIRDKSFPIKKLEIENAKLIMDDKNFLIKKININNSWKAGDLVSRAVSKVNFLNHENDVNLNSTCIFSAQDNLKCDLLLENFIVNSVADLHPNLIFLNHFDTQVNLGFSFAFYDEEFSNISFKLDAKKGSFSFLDFFAEKIDFDNFYATGEFDNKTGVLNLSKAEADFSGSESVKPHISMSLKVSNLKYSDIKLDLNINLQNVLTAKLEKFWPIAIEKNNQIRNWVISHISNGLVKNANANFSLTKTKDGFSLDDIDSKLNFSELDLNYDDFFPKITNLSGQASFTKNNMNIAIDGGNVLETKINKVQIAIDDFFAHQLILKISGNSQGKASDSIKHANYKSDFAKDVEKYLNGNSVNNFDVRIPLQDKILLQDIYIAANSKVSGIDNLYLNGDAIIDVKKDFASNDFVSKIDLTKSSLHLKEFDVTKDDGLEGGLNFILSVLNNKISINNISLWKKNISQISAVKIYGEVAFDLEPFMLTKLEIKNHNFGKNDYDIFYVADKKTSKQNLNIKGKYLNLAALLDSKIFSSSSSSNKFSNSQIQIVLNDLNLLGDKKIRNLYFFLNCKNNFCFDGVANASYSKSNAISLRLTNTQKNIANLNGAINNIGYLAEAFGISKVVSLGNAKIKAQNQMAEGKQNLSGEIKIDNPITFYESETVKKLAKNDLFSKIQDTIFSNNKTTFDSLKLDFAVNKDALTINSLIANNYKIGITAKGIVNLKGDNYAIKGMIIPGFVINNLFGIGKIPLIGGVISGVLTGGEGGGLFGIRYEYVKKSGDKEGVFTTNKVSSFLPTTIQNLFDEI